MLVLRSASPAPLRLIAYTQIWSSLISSIDSNVDKSSIRDSFRLGKYKSDSTKPRPILVKFTRSVDAASILHNRGSVASPFALKADLSPAQRAIEKILLQVFFSLVYLGKKLR